MISLLLLLEETFAFPTVDLSYRIPFITVVSPPDPVDKFRCNKMLFLAQLPGTSDFLFK